MRILLVADGRSPITRRWTEELLLADYDVMLVSSFPFDPIEGLTRFAVLPIAFARFAGSQVGKGGHSGKEEPSSKPSALKGLVSRYRGILQAARYWLGPLTLPFYGRQLRAVIGNFQPDLVHALRIPFEGMLASYLPDSIPFVVSIWGNDLTLHAPKSPMMKYLTRKVLRRADGLITDVYRDLALAKEWGYEHGKPELVVLTSGGIDFDRLNQLETEAADPLIDELPKDHPLIVNPRGLRPGYVRNDTFFAAIPKVLEQWGKPVTFVCPSMAGQRQALDWIEEYQIAEHVRLLPYLSQQQLWQLFNRSALMISVTMHDGTPNTLLESVSCGCFPIVGDIDSLREWIKDGENGLLVDYADSTQLAAAIVRALEDPILRQRAAAANHQLVFERASVSQVRMMRDQFYNQILNQVRS
ncbi:MAG: glycosyltransferase [Anaerolineaceae bacterium]|nr:glycosyltransferase [Anaerolineaceae bacterium]